MVEPTEPNDYGATSRIGYTIQANINKKPFLIYLIVIIIFITCIIVGSIISIIIIIKKRKTKKQNEKRKDTKPSVPPHNVPFAKRSTSLMDDYSLLHLPLP